MKLHDEYFYIMLNIIWDFFDTLEHDSHSFRMLNESLGLV